MSVEAFLIKGIVKLGFRKKKSTFSRTSIYPRGFVPLRVQVSMDSNLNFGAVKVRLPGFEPGSSTWQAEVLNQARLQPHVHAFGWYTTLTKII